MSTVVLRPRKIRRVCFVLAPVVVLVFALLATLLSGSTGEGTAVFQRGDQVAMVVLGLLAAGAILLFTRPKVTADTEHIKIQNVLGGYDIPWTIVRRVRFDRGNPWVSLELEDDDVIAVMAVQAADKEHAVAGVRTLRALLAAHRAAADAPDAPDAPASPAGPASSPGSASPVSPASPAGPASPSGSASPVSPASPATPTPPPPPAPTSPL